MLLLHRRSYYCSQDLEAFNILHVNVFFLRKSLWPNKYNCSGLPVLKSQSIGYQSKKKLLYHYQYSKNQFNS